MANSVLLDTNIVIAVLSNTRTLNRSKIGKLAGYFHVSPGVFAFDD